MNRTRIITIGGTLFCAMGIGFFMQNTPTEPASLPSAAVSEPVTRSDFKPLSEPAFPAQSQSAVSSSLIETPFEGVVDAIAEVDVSLDPEPQPEVDLAALSEDTLPEMPAEPELPAEPDCPISTLATVDAGAMVRLDIDAPCLANERAVIHHNGMMFTVTTDEAMPKNVSSNIFLSKSLVSKYK